ncbi:hypothetical protein ADIARSV_4205 [Arcticibacter svalbardensis MN12-7]|uniref:DUF3278 domain-containing protein n=1 Tax=Arcticibacter svalbardensis MN12-7 TaxID=1150600 RepID=R9GLV7_9SPHI|nr:hypothetical protein [Arcticibacter svalbardensis]EOR92693.1 hypothetical protein ADIARSV_4205 [Arcticibacter svalbardensis MN12-7]
MELDDLKASWNNLDTPVKTTEEIKKMLLENNHPVLKAIRRQLTLEIAGWSLFLICYYTMFDGDKKPLLINIILLICTLFPLVHNLMGYRFAKYLLKGTTLRESIENYFSNVKRYAMISILTRAFYASGLLLFFLYNVQFTTEKYMLLGGIILFFGVHSYFVYLLWKRRLGQLERALSNFG